MRLWALTHVCPSGEYGFPLSICVRPATWAGGGALIDRYPCAHYRRRNLPDYVDQGDQERRNLPKV